jgi:glycosyltransferase involved in cell wall biosynthesis
MKPSAPVTAASVDRKSPPETTKKPWWPYYGRPRRQPAVIPRRSTRIDQSPSAGAPRRFVFVITALARGGMLSVMQQFWARLGRHGVVEVIAHGPNSVEVEIPSHEIGPRRLSSPYRFPHVLLYAVRVCVACIQAVHRRPHPAVLLVQDALGTGLGAALAGRLTGTTVVVMEHGAARAIETEFFWNVRMPAVRLRERLTRPLLRRTLRLMHRAVLRLLDLALVPSQESVDLYLRGGVDAERIIRYHVPIDTDRFRPGDAEEKRVLRTELELPPERRVILSVSRLTPEKGIELLIDAVAALPADDREPNMLVIAGDGALRSALEERATACGVPARFTGSVSADDLPGLLRAADLFVYAARQGSNVPVAVLEAMASGLPVVGTTEPIAHVEILAEGRGIAIPPEDRHALVEAMAFYLGAPEQRASAGQLGRAYVVEHHSHDVFDRELDAFVVRLASMGPARRGR